MKRLLSLLAIVLLQLAASQPASCVPPDRVSGSPVPPLEPPATKQSQWKGDRATIGLGSPLSLDTKPKATKPANRQKSSAKKLSDKQQGKQPGDYSDGYEDLWNSRAMREARGSIVEFCRRAAQTSPEEGEQFLEQLSKLPPDQMKNWLDRYLARKESMVRNQERDAMTRRLGVERSLDRIEATRRSAENAAELRRQAAQARAESMSRMPWRRSYSFGVGDLTRNFGFQYDPMEAVVDPMSPRGYERKVAAAMSLPGDLPASDQRNFIRGEAGVNLGQGANGPQAPPGQPQPPTPAPPSAPPQ